MDALLCWTYPAEPCRPIPPRSGSSWRTSGARRRVIGGVDQGTTQWWQRREERRERTRSRAAAAAAGPGGTAVASAAPVTEGIALDAALQVPAPMQVLRGIHGPHQCRQVLE